MKAADIVVGLDYVTGDPRDWRAAQENPRKLISPHGYLRSDLTVVTVDAIAGRVVRGHLKDRHPYGQETDVTLGRVLALAADLEDLQRRGEQLIADDKAAARAAKIAGEEAAGWANLPINHAMACTRCGVPVVDWPGERINRDRHEAHHRELDALHPAPAA